MRTTVSSALTYSWLLDSSHDHRHVIITTIYTTTRAKSCVFELRLFTVKYTAFLVDEMRRCFGPSAIFGLRN